MKKQILEAFGEVLTSVAGSIGVVLLISWLIAANDNTLQTGSAFLKYFEGGQAGLTILAVSSAAFGALLRHPRKDKLGSVLLGLLLLVPIIGTSIIIGMNPGFSTEGITEKTISILWWLFIGVHLLWFVFIVTSPTSPDLGEEDAAQETRVNDIKAGAAGRG